ncbi:MAG: dihydrodipicolinate synthase family protein, partial [Thermomicrobiales bacterium]
DTRIQELCARIRGPVNSIYTSFTAEGEVDWSGVRNMVEAGIAGDSEISLLTFGDSQLDFLGDQEVADLTSVLVDQSAGRALTVAATKRWWQGQTLEFARYCRELGVDLLMMLPSDHAMSAEGKIAWYKAVAREIPVMLVGYPTFDILDGVRDEPRICAFKEDGTLDYSLGMMIRYPHQWSFITGGMYRRHLAQWPYGCTAFFSWASTFAPTVAQRYWTAVQHNDLAVATEIIATIEAPYFGLIERFPERFQDLHRGALELNGIAKRYLRPPRRSLTDGEMEELSAALKPLGLLGNG